MSASPKTKSAVITFLIYDAKNNKMYEMHDNAVLDEAGAELKLSLELDTIIVENLLDYMPATRVAYLLSQGYNGLYLIGSL